MRAYKLLSPGKAEIQEVPKPEPGSGEVLIKVEAAGICRSDLHFLNQDESWPFFGTTLGHETAGTIVELGPDTSRFSEGDRVLVSAIWSCGECHHCTTGRENACSVTGTRTQFPVSPGIVVDGGMADYIKANERHLVPIGDLDAAVAAPLADAGMTPMHAINTVRDRLDPEATVVLIGVGGLGHVALQVLVAIENSPKVIAIDMEEGKRKQALDLGAIAAISPDEADAYVEELTNGVGVDVIIDFVGTQGTLDQATRLIGSEGAIRIVGLTGGTLGVEATLVGEPLPWGVNIERAYGGTAEDVQEVADLANAGKVHIGTTQYPLDEATRAMQELDDGKVAGRAVLIP